MLETNGGAERQGGVDPKCESFLGRFGSDPTERMKSHQISGKAERTVETTHRLTVC
jgi:hypothetical protein